MFFGLFGIMMMFFCLFLCSTRVSQSEHVRCNQRLLGYHRQGCHRLFIYSFILLLMELMYVMLENTSIILQKKILFDPVMLQWPYYLLMSLRWYTFDKLSNASNSFFTTSWHRKQLSRMYVAEMYLFSCEFHAGLIYGNFKT